MASATETSSGHCGRTAAQLPHAPSGGAVIVMLPLYGGDGDLGWTRYQAEIYDKDATL
jgi:hypothetical protein